jgi:hypothetical protein
MPEYHVSRDHRGGRKQRGLIGEVLLGSLDEPRQVRKPFPDALMRLGDLDVGQVDLGVGQEPTPGTLIRPSELATLRALIPSHCHFGVTRVVRV